MTDLKLPELLARFESHERCLRMRTLEESRFWVEQYRMLARDLTAYATAAVLAEREALLHEIADLHDTLRTIYSVVPPLPVTPETCEQATDALTSLCMAVGIHKVEIGGL